MQILFKKVYNYILKITKKFQFILYWISIFIIYNCDFIIYENLWK